MTEKLDKDFEKAVTYTIELYEILKNMRIRDHTGEWLQFLHWERIMSNEQKQARTLMDKIVRIVINQNNQISERIVHVRVIYGLLEQAIWYTKDYPDFPSEARKEIKILFEYDAFRIIDIPLVYLVAESSPVKFGAITINNVTEEDRKHKWWEKILASGGENYSVRTYARISSKGDLQISLENAKAVVNDMMIFLRAIGFPITTKQQNQFGLLNEYSALLIPYRIDIPVENSKLEHPVQLSTAVSALHTYEIQKDIFSQISLETLIELQKLIDKDYLKASTELKRKFFLGLRWLGEATKPDIVSARFVKLSFSLEGFIGGEISDSRETKITLAKRCAIVAGENLIDQKKLYNAILRYYNKRSDIVHGVDKKITEEEFSGFGKNVRKVAWSLLEKIDDFNDINELHSWVIAHPSWSLL